VGGGDAAAAGGRLSDDLRYVTLTTLRFAKGKDGRVVGDATTRDIDSTVTSTPLIYCILYV